MVLRLGISLLKFPFSWILDWIVPMNLCEMKLGVLSGGN